MAKTKLRLLSVGLALLLLITAAAFIIPGTKAKAASAVWDGSVATGYASGSGTEEDPYIIKTAPQLAYFEMMANKKGGYNGKYVKLAEDIVLNESGSTARSWNPIGEYVLSRPFEGTFDGDGHTISGVYVNYSYNGAGFFGYSKGTIKNVGIIECNINGSQDYVGGVCGLNIGTIQNCYATGKVSGPEDVGGVVGYNGVTSSNTGSVKKCYSLCSVSGTREIVGGVCGLNRSEISDCFSVGAISAYRVVGGVCGQNYQETNGTCTLTNCFSVCTVKGSNTMGGVCGINTGKVQYCYYDTEYYTGSVSGSTGGTVENSSGKTTVELCSASLPAGFSSSVWNGGSTQSSSSERLRVKNYYLPSLKGVGTAQAIKKAEYNFRINNTDDWQPCELISSEAELLALANDSSKWGGNYVLTQNITLTAPANEGDSNFTPIGNVDAQFTGKFSGDGHTISGMVINNTANNYQGLFGYSTGLIMEVGVIDCSVAGKDYVGGVCGNNFGTIASCYNTGTVSGTIAVGGVCGMNHSTVTSCYNTGEVSGKDNIGGVCGYINSGTVSYCYNLGTVSGAANVGGVSGRNISTVKNSYSAAIVTGNSDVGGVNGYNSGTVTSCYSDTDFFSGNAIGNEQGTSTSVEVLTTSALIGKFPSDSVWNAGSAGAVTTTGERFRVQTVTFPSLKNVGTALSAEIKTYNFGKNGAEEWLAYTEISTAEELTALSQNSSMWSGNYVLTDNITLNAPASEGDSNWTPIGNNTTYFTGRFSGDGHIVSGIVINDTAKDYQGLFGFSKGLIMDVGVIDSSVTGNQYVGSVCGFNNGGTIINCYNIGDISGNSMVGGICGFCYYGGSVSYCYNTGAVSGIRDIGGVCGYNDDSTVSYCYSLGSVSGIRDIGGVCGYNDDSTVSYCYSLGSVSGTTDIGGVCGYNNSGTVSNCYSAATVSGGSCVGGVCGVSSGTVTSCYSGSEFCSGKAIGNEQGTSTNVEALATSALIGKFPSDAVWNAGSAGEVTTTGERLRAQTVTFPSLKNVGTAQSVEIKTYNFGINGAENWSIYTEISNEAELRALAADSSKWGGSYILTNNITLTAPASEGDSNWTPIGNNTTYFTGRFSGDGHTVSGIVINDTAKDYQGLFGHSKGLIMDVSVTDSSVTSKDYIGSVCGFNNGGTISNCSNAGTVTGTQYIGGVCGMNLGGTITNCYNTGDISGDSVVGGLCGYNNSGSTVSYCYNIGAVSGRANIGGVSGSNDNSTVSYCYNLGAVYGTANIGGVCGYNNSGTVSNCYSAAMVSGSYYVGGVCGDNSNGTVTSCYFSTEFYSGNAVGSQNGTLTNVEGLTTSALIGIFPTDAVWNAGSAGEVTTTGERLRQQTFTMPSLKNAGTAHTIELKLYNFGVNGAEDWRTYTEISNEAELRALANDSSKWGGSYILTNNITLTAPASEGDSNWTPIGNITTYFTGKFSGDGHTVSGIVINDPAKEYQGLFGYSTGLIMNVGVIDSSVTGKGCISGVCGSNDGGTVTNCFNTGTVSGEYNVGGVCGYCCSGAVVTYCYNTGAISGTVAESTGIGGVSGSGYNGCTITNCYNTGAVYGTSNIGGVCGIKEGGTFSYCYNTGSVSGSFYVGGVCGYFSGGAATSCYSAATVTGINPVGGVFGLSSGTLTSCYFSTELYSGNAVGNEQGTSTNVEGLTITELLAKFPADAVWNAGSAGAVTTTGERFREQTVTLPSLKNVGTAQTIELKLYNFGINGTENWSIYTEISNEAELRALANDSSKWGGSYILTNNITLTAPASEGDSNWTPIGSMSKPFSGKFSGDGRTISGMVINNTATDGQGLFGVSSGLIMNVGVVDSSVTGKNNVGGVCGYNINGGRIAYCYNTGSVTGSGQVGGICGQNLNGAISNCYNIGSVNGTSGVGGVCGSSSTALVNCYYNSDLSGDNNAGATGLNTLQMTCADALDIMGFDKTIWVKKANDKENKLAFYPSFSEEAATSVGYTTKLGISLADSGNPVFGEELKLKVSALVKFTGMNDFAASEEAYAGEGSFEIKCGDEYITTTAFDLPDNTVVDYTYIKGDINAGTYTFTLEYDGTGSDYLSSDTATLSVTVDKADFEEEISTIEHSHAWNISGDCTVSEIAALLPENYGEITGVVPGATGDIEIIRGKSYTDGEFKYTLADNTRDDIGKTATITYTISTTNYNDIAVAVKVTVTDKQEQTEKPDCILTVTLVDDNSYTAVITPVEGAEYSFDGTTWSSTNTLTGIAHATTVKAFIRYAETDTYNAGAAASATEKTAHGTLTHHSANPATCTEDGNIEYWTCDSCDKYFSDEEGTTQITQAQTVIEKKGHTPAAAVRENEVPATCTTDGSYDEVVYCTVCDAEISRTPKTITAAGHKWSEKYECDKDGHWHKCKACDATSAKEAHVPGKPATLEHAQNCTVCGYEIAPKLGQVAAPTFSPNGGTFSKSQEVNITCATEGAAIYYTLDGSDPTADSTLYEGAFTLTATTTVKAIAIKDGMAASEITTATFTKKSSGGGGGGGGGYRPTTPTKPLPSIDGNKMPWNEMVDYIKKATSNTFVVGLNGLTEVPENVIKAIADRDSKVTFLVDGTFAWVVDGAEITAPVKADLTVNKSDSVKSDGLRGSVGTKFSANGTSIPAKLTISFKALHAGKFANAYKNVDGKLTFAGCAKIGEDGTVILPNSDGKGEYVVMICEFSDLLGDMNNDGVLSAADASAILKQVVGLANGENPAVADMNGDGKVNAADAAEILKRIVGLA